MAIYVLTSLFPSEFNFETSQKFKEIITDFDSFAFIASDFNAYEKTDKYFKTFLQKFKNIGINFSHSYVIDHRITPKKAADIIQKAKVIWLSGGDTTTQFQYLIQYNLDSLIKNHQGIIIGMSAGSINLAKTSICTLTCNHPSQEIYKGLGCVDISVEPHFDTNFLTDELLDLSEKYTIYGLCDNSMIICYDSHTDFIGDVYIIEKRKLKKIN